MCKIIIDCDPGIDDALAIMLAVNSPELEIVAITTVSGNVPSDMGAVNAKKVLKQLNRLDIPVYIGEDAPLREEYIDARDTHGMDGLGESFLPEVADECEKQSAVGFLTEILEKENIFVMDESRASHQDIRPIQILILNLMPLKEETELQLLRSLSNTPLQVDVTFMAVQSHEAKNTSVSHLNKFYQTFPELKNNKYDGMIITGAPVEQMEFEEVDYWKELVEIMDWTNTHVTSTIYLCWAAQAGLYYHYGLKKRKLDKKMFGLFWHKVMNRKIPLVRGFDDMFLAPHSRHTEVPIEDIHNCKELTVLAESDEAGLFLAMADGGRKIFVMGHPEYDRVTLDGEYKRDVSKNLPIEIPENYYKDNNPENRPLLMWRAHANNLYTNWLNYYVYQSTPFDLYGTPDFSEI